MPEIEWTPEQKIKLREMCAITEADRDDRVRKKMAQLIRQGAVVNEYQELLFTKALEGLYDDGCERGMGQVLGVLQVADL